LPSFSVAKPSLARPSCIIGKSGLRQSLMDPVILEDPLDDTIDRLRTKMQHEGHLALPGLVLASLDHAVMAISHPDEALGKVMEMARSKTRHERVLEVKAVIENLKVWVKNIPLKVTLMVMGLGGTAFKAKAIGQFMLDAAEGFCMRSRRQNLFVRLWDFVALMSVRLVVSTLVPPTSPGFGIIIQAATPDEQKWTAMPRFLVASAIAGAWPWVFDKLLQCFTGKDFCFTKGWRQCRRQRLQKSESKYMKNKAMLPKGKSVHIRRQFFRTQAQRAQLM